MGILTRELGIQTVPSIGRPSVLDGKLGSSDLNRAWLQGLREAFGDEAVDLLLVTSAAATQGRLARLRLAEDPHAEAVALVAHELHGAAVSIGAERLAALARDLGEAIRVGIDGATRHLVRSTAEELEAVSSHLFFHMSAEGGEQAAGGDKDPSGDVMASASTSAQVWRHDLGDDVEAIRVLVVDDAAEVRLLGRIVLASAGCSVEVAANGLEALDRINDDEPPDVVVLDLHMPEMNGWVTLEAIRAAPASSRIGVVVCSVNDRPEDFIRACRLGADGYLTKPYVPHDLVYVATEVALRSDAERQRLRASRARMAAPAAGHSDEG